MLGLLFRPLAVGFVQLAFGNLHLNAGGFADFGFDFGGNGRVFFQPDAGIVFALTDFFAVVAVPGARFVDDFQIGAQLDQFAFPADAFAVENVEFGMAEGRRLCF